MEFELSLKITSIGKIVTRTEGSQLSYQDIIKILEAHKNSFKKRFQKKLSTPHPQFIQTTIDPSIDEYEVK